MILPIHLGDSYQCIIIFVLSQEPLMSFLYFLVRKLSWPSLENQWWGIFTDCFLFRFLSFLLPFRHSLCRASVKSSKSWPINKQTIMKKSKKTIVEKTIEKELGTKTGSLSNCKSFHALIGRCCRKEDRTRAVFYCLQSQIHWTSRKIRCFEESSGMLMITFIPTDCRDDGCQSKKWLHSGDWPT